MFTQVMHTIQSTVQIIMISTVATYELCVPVLRKAMQNHRDVLKKGEEWCDQNGYPHSKLLSARLSPDMHVCISIFCLLGNQQPRLIICQP